MIQDNMKEMDEIKNMLTNMWHEGDIIMNIYQYIVWWWLICCPFNSSNIMINDDNVKVGNS